MKVVRKLGYQKSPTVWEVKAIGDVLNVVERPVKMDSDKSYRRVTVKRRHGGIELRDIQLGADIKVKNQYLIKAGDFLISERQIVHGACGIVPSELEGALVSNEYLVLKASKGLDTRYFNYLVQLLKYAKLFLQCSQGVDIEKFLFKPKAWLKKEIPFPPLPEQQKIAAILTTMDDKLEVIARQIAATETLKRGLMQTLFRRGVGTQGTNGRWVPHAEFKDSELGEIPSKWHVGKVGDYVAALRSGVSVNAEDRLHKKSELGVLKVSCVFKGKFLPHAHKTVLETEVCRVAEPVLGGRIIISRANTPSLVGESAFVAEGKSDLFLPDKLWQTEPSNIPHSVRWLAFYLQSEFSRQEISKAATGTSGSMKNIAKPAFLGIPMPLMDVDEQAQIARILSSVTEKLDALHTKQSKFKELKRGLMQKLLTGDWRVKCNVLIAENASTDISATTVTPPEKKTSLLMEEALIS